MPEAGQLYVELWVSLASLLRSYTAAHGLNKNQQATVELGEERITVRHGHAWLDLQRYGTQIDWQREDGRSGQMKLTESGRLRAVAHESLTAGNLGHPDEEEMDMVAEAWARELMA